MNHDTLEAVTESKPFVTMKSKGQVTRLYSTPRGATYERELTIGLRAKVTPDDHAVGLVLYVEEGGVTGYESFTIGKYVHWPRMIRHGWGACAGTEGRYDRLVISGPEMQRIHDWVAQIFTSLDI